MAKPVCVVVGVGPGNGAALVKRYAAEGYAIAMLARSDDVGKALEKEIGGSRFYRCDVGDVAAVTATFATISGDLGPVETLVYNAGSGLRGSITDISPADFEASWRINALGLLAASQAVLPAMQQKKQGSIIVIGATASRRGNIKTAAFAPAKAAQRSLAEAMAKQLWPQGIHIALIIIDGIVDIPRTRQLFQDKADDFFVRPEDVAETAFWLTRQPRSAWAFEVEARPFGETW
ncbi:MAG: SDR family NAD(P)-dependent oxidoreductase [Rhodospirillaceae bacterium]|nr:MAG: SDR family NAD(P)-dependent oxidoreductase [Rhodospirillaceae bacterium]